MWALLVWCHLFINNVTRIISQNTSLALQLQDGSYPPGFCSGSPEHLDMVRKYKGALLVCCNKFILVKRSGFSTDFSSPFHHFLQKYLEERDEEIIQEMVASLRDIQQLTAAIHDMQRELELDREIQLK